jgi:H+-transporting ATPase
VRHGEAVAEIIATGAKTSFGQGAEMVRVAHTRSTEQSAVFSVTRNLALVNGAVALMIVACAQYVVLPAAELIRLALTALLATIPAALSATFALSSPIAAQMLVRHRVLLFPCRPRMRLPVAERRFISFCGDGFVLEDGRPMNKGQP